MEQGQNDPQRDSMSVCLHDYTAASTDIFLPVRSSIIPSGEHAAAAPP
jgi:hypothetical protein